MKQTLIPVPCRWRLRMVTGLLLHSIALMSTALSQDCATPYTRLPNAMQSQVSPKKAGTYRSDILQTPPPATDLAQSQSAMNLRPTLTPTPSAQDWSFLADPITSPTAHDYFDRIKFIRLDKAGCNYLTLGNQSRLLYERLDYPSFGASNTDLAGYVLFREMPNFDLHLGRSFRLFTNFSFDYEGGRVGGPRPGIDEHVADVDEAFVDLGSNFSKKQSGLTLRVGRQALYYAEGQVLQDDEGVNVKSSFDGVRMMVRSHGYEVDGLAVRPVSVKTGAFDDVPNHAQTLAGLYITTPVYQAIPVRFDLYYLYLDTKNALYQRGQGRDQRDTIGLRIQGTKGPIDIGWEGDGQFGTFAGRDVRAWSYAAYTGYTLRTSSLKPRFGVRLGGASGDHPTGKNMGSYNPLFARATYFEKEVLAGPINFYLAKPVIGIQPRRNLLIQVSWDWFWRQSLSDGAYGLGGGIVKIGSPSGGRYVGSIGSGDLEWTLNRHMGFSVNVSRFFTSTFLTRTPPAKNVNFVQVGPTYRF